MTKFLLAVFVALTFVSAPFAYAHDLAIDGEVGAVMHIEPNDDPIAGEPSTLIFEFKDSKQAFSGSDYAITIAITSGSTTVATSTLELNGADASYGYVFPQAGDYSIMVTGTPAANAPAFMLMYEAQAQAASSASATTAERHGFTAIFGVHGGHVLITVLLIIILIYVVIAEKRKERRIASGKAPKEG